jgi:hypothetical protein
MPRISRCVHGTMQGISQYTLHTTVGWVNDRQVHCTRQLCEVNDTSWEEYVKVMHSGEKENATIDHTWHQLNCTVWMVWIVWLLWIGREGGVDDWVNSRMDDSNCDMIRCEDMSGWDEMCLCLVCVSVAVKWVKSRGRLNLNNQVDRWTMRWPAKDTKCKVSIDGAENG